MVRVHPFIVGHGRAGLAIEQSLAILRTQMADVAITAPVWVQRNESLTPAGDGLSLAILSNPPGLHADRILEAEVAGFHGLATEKPACVSTQQADVLSSLKMKTAVYHVYRQMWGPQKLKSMITDGVFGTIVTIEGRYWQSSTADRALNGPASGSWKNDPKLSGPSDVLLDVGTHWADMAVYLANDFPSRISGWSSYANSETPHRDSHIHLTMEFEKGPRALSSITKNSHGSTNHFEINIFGTKASATWTFLHPDEILFGQGRERRVISRMTNVLGTRHPPFHGAGWLEGYVEITRQLVNQMTGRTDTDRIPTVPENARLIHALLSAGLLRNENDI